MDFKLEDKTDIIDVEGIMAGWHTLSKFLYETKSVSNCMKLVEYERRNKNRAFILERITSRIVNLGSVQIRKWVRDGATESEWVEGERYRGVSGEKGEGDKR